MKKIKQLLAIIGIILLVGLYLSTLVLAIIDNSNTMKLFHACVYATVIIPVLIWAYSLIYKLVTKKDDRKQDVRKDPVTSVTSQSGGQDTTQDGS